MPRRKSMKKKMMTEIIVVLAAAAVILGPSLMRIAKERLKLKFPLLKPQPKE
jgi:hypothetical protein